MRKITYLEFTFNKSINLVRISWAAAGISSTHSQYSTIIFSNIKTVLEKKNNGLHRKAVSVCTRN